MFSGLRKLSVRGVDIGDGGAGSPLWTPRIPLPLGIRRAGPPFQAVHLVCGSAPRTWLPLKGSAALTTNVLSMRCGEWKDLRTTVQGAPRSVPFDPGCSKSVKSPPRHHAPHASSPSSGWPTARKATNWALPRILAQSPTYLAHPRLRSSFDRTGILSWPDCVARKCQSGYR